MPTAGQYKLYQLNLSTQVFPHSFINFKGGGLTVILRHGQTVEERKVELDGSQHCLSNLQDDQEDLEEQEEGRTIMVTKKDRNCCFDHACTFDIA
jgi:hypothetical protein